MGGIPNQLHVILLGNLLWLILGGGLFAALGWFLVGVLLALTIVGIPFAIAAFRIAGFAAWPFGRVLVDNRAVGADRLPGTGLANFLWIVLAGLWLTLGHLFAGVACILTVVGIPFGLAHLKLASVSLAPLGKTPVPTGMRPLHPRPAF